MKSVAVNVFFSCSFSDEDKNVNNFFHSIAKALEVNCANVDTSYALTPPAQAKQMINDSQGLIAICTRRTKKDDNEYIMPTAVQEELTMAFAMSLPVLMFVENEVLIDGFKSNYGTYKLFDRTKLKDDDMIHAIIKAIHEFKLMLVSDYNVLIDQGADEFYAEYLYRLLELKCSGDEYAWEYTNTKKLKFLKPYKKALKTAAWAEFPFEVPSDAEVVDWKIIVHGGSKDFQIKETVQTLTPLCFEALMKIEPHPEVDDYIEFSVIAKSKYFNPLWLDQIDPKKKHNIDEKDYYCIDGTIPIQRTKKAILEFRFPREYGMMQNDITPFVGSYTSNIDYLVPSELERFKPCIDNFAGNLCVRMEINSPLLHHYYGIAWNPKNKTKAIV
jgi:hypothetical protein